jgi:hypothetical protein
MMGFLRWAFSIGDLIGLQAYRLVTELIHSYLCRELASVLDIPITALELDPTCLLGTQSDRHGFVNMSNQFKNDDMRNAFKRRRLSIRKDASNVSSSSSSLQQAMQQQPLNELVMVTSETDANSTTASTVSEYTVTDPCDFSVLLLIRLRELVRASFGENGVRTPDGTMSIKVLPDTFSSLLASSAFSEFEFETCKLQKVSLKGMSTNQLTLFFCNIYNALIVHAIIVNAKKGAPGSTVFDRNVFMKTAKYNIGGLHYSPLDVS